jgi:hypothetical protein
MFPVPNLDNETSTLQIPRPTITKYIRYLRQQDRENLQNHVQGRLPQEYEKMYEWDQ